MWNHLINLHTPIPMSQNLTQPNQLKPWKSLDEQLAILQSRGMLIDNIDSARSYLERIGYYRLSGYWYPMRSSKLIGENNQITIAIQDSFIEGSHFEDVVKLYVFDKKLRLLLLDALERIETSLRVEIAHLLGQKHKTAHKEKNCLDGNFSKKIITSGNNAGSTEHEVWLKKFLISTLPQRAL